MGTAFEQATAVTRVGASGCYAGDIDATWRTSTVPHGGVVTALALRAMASELDTVELSLRSVTAVFAAPVHDGPLDVEVAVLRRGRSLAQCRAELRSPGNDAGMTALAVFGVPRPGFVFSDLRPPVVPPPEECPSFRDPPPPEAEPRGAPFPFWECHVEGRPALGHPPWDVWQPTGSERAFWYRFDEVPRRDDGTIDPLAIVALCDTMPGAVGERTGGGVEVPWFAPSADLTVHLHAPARGEWLLAHNWGIAAGDGYATAVLHVFDPDTGLVASATQVMVFQFPEGPPSPERLVLPPLTPPR